MGPQQTIAHYRVVAKLGEGGMGEVWRATDTKLNRDVAIKVLPETLAADPDRMARFDREAQVLASLNHPNIAAIYGVEDRALVMELVDGPTLADRIAQGPVSEYGGRLVLPLSGDAKPMPIVSSEFIYTQPQLSPDGRWLADVSDESGRNEIYVEPFSAEGSPPANQWTISNTGDATRGGAVTARSCSISQPTGN